MKIKNKIEDLFEVGEPFAVILFASGTDAEVMYVPDVESGYVYETPLSLHEIEYVYRKLKKLYMYLDLKGGKIYHYKNWVEHYQKYAKP